MLISAGEDLDKEVTHRYGPWRCRPAKNPFGTARARLPARTSFPLRPISRSRNIPTLSGMKKGRPGRKKSPRPQTCGNLRNELHESARLSGRYPNFSGECSSGTPKTPELKVYIISQFREVGGPDT